MSTFEVLANEEDMRGNTREAFTRAITAAKVRAGERFAKFVSAASSDTERQARIDLISADLKTMVEEVAEEYGYNNVPHLEYQAMVSLGGGHASDCSCGFCANKGSFGKDDEDNDAESEKEDEEAYERTPEDASEVKTKKSSVDVRQVVASAPEFPWEHVATDVETGDTFSTERVDLPSSKDGLGGPSPKIDKSNSGDNTGWDLKPIDVPSKQHPTEQQEIHEEPNYEAALPGVSETGKSVSADSPIQPEHNTGDRTDTWNGTEGQADPVTSSVLTKWSVA